MESPSGLLPCVEVDPPSGTPPRWSVIWLHGLGANGHDFEPLVPVLGLTPEDAVRFVFPHAPQIPVTINNGFVMPAWYDILELDLRRRHDEAGVRASAELIEALIAREKALGVPAERIVLAGFSQGGALALHVGLRHAERLAGLLALSTYLVCEESVAAERSVANRDVPILQAHGTFDPMVPLQRGEAARDRLKELGYEIRFETYGMAHQVCAEEVDAIGSWLRGIVRAESTPPPA